MKSRTEQSYREGMLRALVHLQQHLDDDLSMHELAGAAHFSRWHFQRIFRSQVGEPIKEHIRRLRLERAAYRLKVTARPVTDIALNAGYETPESFSRAFQARFGTPPSRFRNNTPPLSYTPQPSALHPTPPGHLPDAACTSSSPSDLEVRIERVPIMRVAFFRSIGPYGSGWRAWQHLLEWARQHRLLRRGTLCLGIRHDCTGLTPPDRLRYDAALTVVGDRFVPQGEIGVQEVGGGIYAVVTHRGPYGKRFDTYAWLCNEWVPAQRRVLRAAPVFEIYRYDLGAGRCREPLTVIHVPLES